MLVSLPTLKAHETLHQCNMATIRANRKFAAVAVACVTSLLLLRMQLGPLDPSGTSETRTPIFTGQNGHVLDTLPCRELPGANETLVIIKTGSTELAAKLPIHLNTTLRCYPNYMIFSDFAETFEGHSVLDALEDVSQDIKLNHEDFELYRRLQRESGRAALAQNELSKAATGVKSATGNLNNEGWKLDKWKFNPMLSRTLRDYPDMRWYVFVETDTFILWETLLAYQAALDWTKPYYVGGQTWIGDVEFAHGGSGFLISKRALEMVVKQYTENQSEWETFTDHHWAGDCVLGKTFKTAGISLTTAWPIWQGDEIGNMNYGHADPSHKLWCHPTVSYHHLSASAIKDFWEFEREWAASPKNVSRHALRDASWKIFC